MLKFERTKPHINVGTIGHVSTRSRGSYARSLLHSAAIQIALANAANDTSTASLYGNIGESTGPKTYTTDGNRGPMIDPRNREERRAKKKKKHGNQTASKYKRRNWWE